MEIPEKNSGKSLERDLAAFNELIDYAVKLSDILEIKMSQAIRSSAFVSVVLFVLFSIPGYVYFQISQPNGYIGIYYPPLFYAFSAALILAAAGGSIVFTYLKSRMRSERRALFNVNKIVHETYRLISEELSPIERAKAEVILSRLGN